MPVTASAFREAIRPRPSLSVSEWAERYRLVVDGPLVTESAIPWDNDVFPPGQDIMDAATNTRFRRVLMMAAPQTSGKTAHMINVGLWALHWQNRDVMYVHANQMKGESQYVKKIGPCIERQPELASLIPRSRDLAGTREEHRFTNGRSWFVAGSESEADLSGTTAPVLLFDDVHAMPATLGKHGHPIEFAEKRAAAFPPEERITVCCSQASDVDNWMWRRLIGSSFYALYLPCPACGMYQLLDWSRMQFDASSPEAARKDCWLKCVRCPFQIRHEHLPEMLAGYRWISTPDGLDVVHEPGERTALAMLDGEAVYPETARPCEDAGFWWPAFTWPLVPWTDYAGQWVAARGDSGSAKTFRQHVCVIPEEQIEEDADAIQVEDVAAHQDTGHKWRTVPEAANLLTLSCDVHDRFIYYLVIAWNRETGCSWLVDADTKGVHGPRKGEELTEGEKHAQIGVAIRKALEDLWQMDVGGWPVVGGDRTVRASVAMIDAGHRQDAVGQFCQLRNAGLSRPKWLMVRGEGGRAKGTKIFDPAHYRTGRYGYPYFWVGTTEAKHVMRDILAVPDGKPGYFTVYADRSLETFYRHLSSEHYIEKRRNGQDVKVWEQKPDGGPNHWLDCFVYGIAAAIACGVKLPVFEQQAARGPDPVARPRKIAAPGARTIRRVY